MLDHERLDVYRASIEFLELALRVVDALPRGHAALADQFRRAAMSVPLNIAEAAGKSAAERAHHQRIARGSAMECGAILDVVRLLRVAGEKDIDSGKELLVRVVSMLTRMCQ
jgi:four helix bundle protein